MARRVLGTMPGTARAQGSGARGRGGGRRSASLHRAKSASVQDLPATRPPQHRLAYQCHVEATKIAFHNSGAPCRVLAGGAEGIASGCALDQSVRIASGDVGLTRLQE